MKKNIFYVLLFLPFLFACESSSLNDFDKDVIFLGEYSGYYVRSTPTTRFPASDIQISFFGNRFSGSSASQGYPEICEGTFQFLGDRITFVNTCTPSSNDDFNFILSGTFEINSTDDEFILIKVEDDVTDTYRLSR